MSLNANEFRIGNWVYVITNGNFEQIKNIYENFGHWVKPIPLTEDWLFKFGFEKRDNRTTNEAEFDEWLLGDFGFIENKNGYEFYPYITTIKYVHQLQNLYFALSGEELTIKKCTHG